MGHMFISSVRAGRHLAVWLVWQATRTSLIVREPQRPR